MVRVFFLGKYKLLLLCILLLGLIVGASFFFFDNEREEKAVLEPIYQGDTKEKAVAFAVNVDWGEDIVPEMVELFKQEKVPATFFVTGRFAGKFPDIVKKIDKGRHEVGNHGYSHNHPDRTGFSDNQLEIKKTEEELKKLVDKPAKLYAPPYGECSPPVVEAARKLGYQTIMWTYDTVDWKEGKTSKGIAEGVVSNAQNGGIILMHPKKVTLQALPVIIKELKAQGYKFKKISQIIVSHKNQNN